MKFSSLLLHLSSRTRVPNYIVKTQPCCHRRGSITKSEWVFLEHSTWRITCHPVLTLVWDEQRLKKIDVKWESHQWWIQRERGLWEGPNFKEAPLFLESNRISLVFGLTSNKDQSYMNESCFVFMLYRKCRFCAIFGHCVGMAVYCPLDPPLKVVALHPRLIHISICMCTPTIDGGGIFQDGCIRLGYPSFSASGAQWSPKVAPAASDGHAPGHSGWGFGLAESPDTSKELSWLQEANTHPRKIRYGNPA